MVSDSVEPDVTCVLEIAKKYDRVLQVVSSHSSTKQLYTVGFHLALPPPPPPPPPPDDYKFCMKPCTVHHIAWETVHSICTSMGENRKSSHYAVACQHIHAMAALKFKNIYHAFMKPLPVTMSYLVELNHRRVIVYKFDGF